MKLKNLFLITIFLMIIIGLTGCASKKVPPGINVLPAPANNGVVKEFTIEASQFVFSPSSITVNEGDTVKITLKSLDVAHGFAISEFNVNQRVEAKSEVTFEFIANKKGTYTYFCSVMCGSGHKDMVGTLVVQ